MLQPLRVIFKLLLTSILLGGIFTAQGGSLTGCSLLNIYDPSGFSPGRKIAIGVFEVGGGGVGSNAGPLEKPRELLLERFQRDFKKWKYFSDVSAVGADMATDADYILEGDLIGVGGGSQFGRVFVGGFGNLGKMRVSGRILGRASQPGDSSTRPVLSDWECNVMGGGKWGFEGNAKIARENADAVSDALTREMSKLLHGKEGKTKLDKLEAKDEGDTDKAPITGKTESRKRPWRDKQEWQQSDYDNEIESFVVRSHEARSRGVDVLWLTQPSYRAHTKLLPMLKDTAILQKKEIKPGMLTSLDPVKPFAGQDVVVLLATFSIHSSAAPFLWDSKQIKAATFLEKAGGPPERLAPAQFLDNTIASYMVFDQKKVFAGFSNFRAYHPVILVFPTKRPDGTPFVQNTSDVVELHTEVDGRPVKVSFDLKDFDLKEVSELMMGPG
jgi:hypothetical protein